MKISRILILRILRIDLDPQKLVPAEKKTRKIKRRKNYLPSVKLKTLLLMDLLCVVGIGFCFVLLLFSPFVQ